MRQMIASVLLGVVLVMLATSLAVADTTGCRCGAYLDHGGFIRVNPQVGRLAKACP